MWHSRTNRWGVHGGLLASVVMLVSACAGTPAVDPRPPQITQLQSAAAQVPADLSQPAPAWSGTYQTVFLCGTCPGLAMSVQLRENQTAYVRERVLGEGFRKEIVVTYDGPFRFDPANRNMVVLSPTADAPAAYRFWVGLGWIEMRNHLSGAPLQPPALYRLRKTSLP